MKLPDNSVWIGTSITNKSLEFDAVADTFIQGANIRCRKIIYDEPWNVLWIVGGDEIGAGSNEKGLSKLDLRNNKIWTYGIWGTGLYVFDPDNKLFERYFIYPEVAGNLKFLM